MGLASIAPPFIRRSTTLRRAWHRVREAVLDASTVAPVGLNLGSGRWKCFRWVGTDRVQGGVMTTETVFPFRDGSLSWAFTHHFLEHADDALATHLMREVHRCLRPGGVFRIVVPDFGSAIAHYLKGDDAFFDGELDPATTPAMWAKHGVPYTIENKLLHMVASYRSIPTVRSCHVPWDMDVNAKDESGQWAPIVMYPPEKYLPDYYCGPTQGVDPAMVRHNAETMSTEDFCRWAQEDGPVALRRAGFGHINCWTFEKLDRVLRDLGFREVTQRSFRQSAMPYAVKQGFEAEKHAAASLYVDAVA